MSIVQNNIPLKELLIKYTQIPSSELERIINRAPYTYRKITIPKKNGEKRIVWQPSTSTMLLQYCLLNCVFNKFEISNACYSYRQGIRSPLKENAIKHVGYTHTIHLDFLQFFPSIIPEKLFESIQEVHPGLISDSEKSIVRNICFAYQKNTLRLVIGAPTSPVLSNIYMRKFDEYFISFARQESGWYSRYADDLWFSANKKETCILFHQKVKEYLSRVNYYSCLALNEKKTRVFKANVPRQITGLVITSQQELKVPRRIKRTTRNLIFKLSETGSGVLSKEQKEAVMIQKRILAGYISFIKDNEPEYISTLIMKYGPKYRKALTFKNFIETHNF